MATRATYSLGPPSRPEIKHDSGFLDRFKLRDPTLAERANFAKWSAILEVGEAGQGVPYLPHNNIADALAAYRHFLSGHGKARQFSYERYARGDSSGAVTVQNAILDARAGAEQIYSDQFADKEAVTFQMTSTALSAGRSGDPLFPYPATENWQKAIGAHSIWMSADVEVKAVKSSVTFSMDLTLHIEDMYNFNPGMQDIATGIPDSENGVFEITGLAKQYLNVSTLQRKVTWDKAAATTPAKVTSPNSGRERRPGDNRRARNRL